MVPLRVTWRATSAPAKPPSASSIRDNRRLEGSSSSVSRSPADLARAASSVDEAGVTGTVGDSLPTAEDLPASVRDWVFLSPARATGHVQDPRHLCARIGGAGFWFDGLRNRFITVVAARQEGCGRRAVNVTTPPRLLFFRFDPDLEPEWSAFRYSNCG